MTTLMTILHILVCGALIVIILLQAGKGAGMGAAFGGASQTLFGATGRVTFLTKITIAAAVIFGFTSLGLSFLNAGDHNLMNDYTPPAQAPAGVGVGQPPAGAGVQPGVNPAPATNQPAAPDSDAGLPDLMNSPESSAPAPDAGSPGLGLPGEPSAPTPESAPPESAPAESAPPAPSDAP